MAIIGPDFPKCPGCGKLMKSVVFESVPPAAIREMVRLARYQKLNTNYWYRCDACEIHLHKHAVK